MTCAQSFCARLNGLFLLGVASKVDLADQEGQGQVWVTASHKEDLADRPRALEDHLLVALAVAVEA